MDIVEVDPHDDAAMRAFWDLEQAAQRDYRTHPVLRTYRILTMLRDPHPYYRHVLLAAREDGRTVGTADLGCSVGDNVPMQRTNLAFGYQRVERMHEMQGKLAADA